MPYAVIEPSGCGIHKDRAKLRLDFFLNPDDPNYDKHHAYIVDEASKECQQGYPGEIDNEDNPLDLETYQKWFDSLPHIWQDNPFHSHFIYPNEDITDARLKAKIDSCLSYFYQFHQHCWDESKEFIKEWKKVPVKKGTIRERFIPSNAKDIHKHEAKVQDIVSRRGEFQASPSKIPQQDLNIGGKGTIDVGSPAISRGNLTYLRLTYYHTKVDGSNPANATGEIDTVEAWFDYAESGNSVKYGTFEHLGSNVLKCHDAELYGEVSDGSKQTCTGLSIDITAGEYIGADGRATPQLLLMIGASGGTGKWAKTGQYCDPNDQETFSWSANHILSLYGTGEAIAAPDAPTNVAATDGTHTDKVVVTWTKSAGATGYRVYEGNNLLDTLGDVATYDDEDALAPTITPGTAAASDGTAAAHVALSLLGQSASNGASRTYKVVAFNATGDSDPSDTDTGYRGTTTLTYQWQRSAADSDANYSNISGGTTASYNDTAAPENGDGRYFQCVISMSGAEDGTSTSDRGYRITTPTLTTTAASSILGRTATSGGNITATGDENCTKRGICWNTTGSPTVSDDTAEDNGAGSYGTGAFSKGMTGLTPGTTYYVKSYAYNSAGYGYGDEVSFTTKSYYASGYIGDVIDCTALISSYDRMTWTETLPTANQTITMQIRSSPDNSDWTEWETIYSSPCTSFDTEVQRYLEWRATLATSEGNRTPKLSDFELYWTKKTE